MAEGVALTNTDEARPAYRLVADALEARIRGGEFEVGARLPSLTELCETYKVGRDIARNAIRHLQSRGIAATAKGSGSYVVSTDGLKGPAVDTEVEALRRDVSDLEARMTKLEERLGGGE